MIVPIVPILIGVILIIAILLWIAERYLVTYQESTITINQERNLQVGGGDTLLDYLTRNDIFIPAACGGKASCGLCKVKVKEGGGELLPTEEPFISRSEREEGVRLSCQLKVREEVQIQLPEYLLEAKQYRGRVISKKDLTHDTQELDIQIIEDQFIFKPGQYIQIKIPGTDQFRAYSVASSPDQPDKIKLIVTDVPGGLCTTYIHKALETGDELTFTGPFGDLYLREDTDRPIVAMARASGIAPIRSIIYYLKNRGMPREFQFFFSCHTPKDLFYVEEFRKLEREYPNFHYIPSPSHEHPEIKWEGVCQRATITADQKLGALKEWEAYLCGPPVMVDAAIKVLEKKGMKKENIHYEAF